MLVSLVTLISATIARSDNTQAVHVGRLADGGGDGGNGGINFNWLSLLTPTTVLILVITAVVLLGVVTIAAAVVYRRLKKRGVIDQGLISLRAQTLPDGPERELNELRLQLKRSVSGTLRAVASAADAGREVGDLQAVTARLAQVADGVDRDLTLLAFETDSHTQRSLLDPARQRVKAVTDAASRVRTALLQESAVLQEGEAANVTAALDDEVSRLSSFTQAYRELRGGT